MIFGIFAFLLTAALGWTALLMEGEDLI